MFNHYTYIPVEHHVALESSVRNHWMGNEARLAALYKMAQAGLTGQQTALASAKGILPSVLRDPKFTVSVATDAESGVYVQLAQLKDQPLGKTALLTVGQKWAAENPASVGSNPTKLW